MFLRKFFTNKMRGPALQSLLARPTAITSSGPICSQWRQQARGFHFNAITGDLHQPNDVYVGIGGGVSVVAHIEQFCKDYYEKYHRFPKITLVTDEKSHWLRQIHSDHATRLWGQPVKALIVPYQKLSMKLYPNLWGDEYPVLAQIKEMREKYFDHVCKTYGVNWIDQRVDRIEQPQNADGVRLIYQNGQVENWEKETNLKIYNFSTRARSPFNLQLAAVAQDGGLIYSQKKSTEPVCIIGGGLTALWAAHDCEGPVVVIRPKRFPLRFDAPPEHQHFSELIEEDSKIELLKDGDILVEGLDLISGMSLRIRIPKERFFLSTGSEFNYALTKNIRNIVSEINPFSPEGRKAGAYAMGTVNPEGGLVHVHTTITYLLGRFPIEDFANVSRYTNLWHDYVEREAAKKCIVIDKEYFNAIEPVMNELFRKTAVPSESELEEILRGKYETLPIKQGRPTWSDVRDILVPVTSEFDHLLHPEANHQYWITSNIKP